MTSYRQRGHTGYGASVIIPITFSLDTIAYTANDVLAATQEMANVTRKDAGTAILTDLVIVDEDDQTAAAMDVYFFDANVALGTENAAISITDADARNILGIVSIAAADWKDTINSKTANIRNINLMVKSGTGSTSIWVALVTGGIPTQTASGITGRFKFLQD